MASDLKIASRVIEGNIVFLDLEGSLDSHTYDRLEDELNRWFDRDYYRVIVRMRYVEYISSAGVGVFVGAVNTTQEADGDLVLLETTSKVREIFELLGLARILNFAPDLEAALDYF
ncbi:MAG: STAS domain-containing protein [Planctomycetes bacterium]|nr:STAS domain-containing protein [Planctomycetota bacterium]